MTTFRATLGPCSGHRAWHIYKTEFEAEPLTSGRYGTPPPSTALPGKVAGVARCTGVPVALGWEDGPPAGFRLALALREERLVCRQSGEQGMAKALSSGDSSEATRRAVQRGLTSLLVRPARTLLRVEACIVRPAFGGLSSEKTCVCRDTEARK